MVDVINATSKSVNDIRGKVDLVSHEFEAASFRFFSFMLEKKEMDFNYNGKYRTTSQETQANKSIRMLEDEIAGFASEACAWKTKVHIFTLLTFDCAQLAVPKFSLKPIQGQRGKLP